MANESSGAILRHVHTIFRAGSSASMTDGQLQERYRAGTSDAAEAAFAALVERHACLVFGSCRAVLGDAHDAEDAFQATFLVLARRARSIRGEGSMASWLSRVARRIAIKARRRAVIRRGHEREAAERATRRDGSARAPEFYGELYEEIDRLPEKFRGPVVLCDLEGYSYEQAAEQLLVPVGTVRSRLSRARGRLRSRLIRRGLAPASAGAAILLGTRSATAAPPLATTEAVIRAATDLAAGRAGAGAISAEAAWLAHSFLRSRRMVRLAMIAMTLISAGLAALGAGMRAAPREPSLVVAEAPASEMVFAKVVDMQGRPVPGQEVHVLGGIGGHRTLKSDAGGMARIPVDVNGRRFLMLIAVPDEKTIGWATLGVGPEDRARGTADDPLTLTLRPRDESITGSVVDRGGRPIAGVRVNVEYMHNDINGWVTRYGVTFPGWPIVAVTDEQGRYTIPLPRGTGGSLLTRHRRYAGPWIRFGTDRQPIGPTPLDPAGSIVGVIMDAATGRPVAGASVGAQALEHRLKIVGMWGEATTDDRGRFEIGGLAPGIFNVLFLHGPEGRHTMTAAAVEAVRVKADRDTEADLSAVEGRKLRGTVVDAETKAHLPGVMVGYYGTARPRSGAAVMSATTDAAGRFELAIPPGRSYVYIMDRSSAVHSSKRDLDVLADRDPEPIRLLGSAAPTVERPIAKAKIGAVRKAAEKTAAKQARDEPEEKAPGTLLTGRVVDPAGAPVPGVRVYCNEGQLVEAATDRDGEFILEGVPDGPQSLVMNKEGYRTSTVRVGADVAPERYILTPRPNADRKVAPSPTDLPAGVRFVDLQPEANEPLDEGPGPNGDDLAELPLGVRKLGGSWFAVGPMIIHLRAKVQPRLPKRAGGLKVGTPCVRLHFLHGTEHEVADRTTIGTYTVRYADGTAETIPIVYGEDLSVWRTSRGGPGKASLANVVWTGKNRLTELNAGSNVYLFEMVWTNPHPDKSIATIDFESAETDCSPFLVAVTVDKK